MNQSSRGGFLARSRAALDIAASLAVVVGVAIVGYQMLHATSAPLPRNSTLAIPSAPLSLDGAILVGNPSAKVAMLEFSDFQCPFCGKFSAEILPTLRKDFIGTGRLLFAFRNMPIQSHQFAEPAALAASCAADQGKFDAFHDLLFANQKSLNEGSLDKFVTTVGLDRSIYAECVQRTAPGKVKADKDLAHVLGVSGTPVFFVGTLGSNGQLVVRKTIKGTKPVDEYVSAVNQALAAK